jgi:cell division protein ZapA
MELNIADDYFKAKKQIAVLEADIESQDQEICDLKHDLIAEKCKRESIDKTMDGMKQEIARYKELIAEKERQISEKDKLIAEKEKEITKLSNRQKA